MVFVYNETLNTEAIYSLGTGLAVLFLGFLNYAASKLLIIQLVTIAIIANALQVIYGISSLITFNSPESYFGVTIFLIILIVLLYFVSQINHLLDQRFRLSSFAL